MLAVLVSPTIGALRRANGWTDDYARHALAVAIVEEAQRRALIDRLDGIMRSLAAGGSPRQAVARLAALVADCGGAQHEEEAAA